MTKIKTVIVEDELHSLERLKTLLANFRQIEVIGEAGDGETAVAVINELKPDLVFLDIQLPVFNGFTVLQKLSVNLKVIFVTSYDQYAIRAFDENAVDYILKPTSQERLAKSIDRISESSLTIDERLISLLRKKVFPEYITRFAVKLRDEVLIIPSEKVYYFRTDNKYLFLVTNEKEYFYESTLKDLDEILDPYKFIRVNKSSIVAIDKIEKLSKWFFGEYNIILSDKKGTTIKIGRKYLSLCMEKIKF